MKAYKILQSVLVSAALATPFSAAAESYEFGAGISGADAALYSQMGVVDSGARYEYLNGRAQEGSGLVQTASRENATKNKQQVAEKKQSEYRMSKKREAKIERYVHQTAKKREADRKAGRSVFDEYL